jgi:hypothetical protein
MRAQKRNGGFLKKRYLLSDAAHGMSGEIVDDKYGKRTRDFGEIAANATDMGSFEKTGNMKRPRGLADQSCFQSDRRKFQSEDFAVEAFTLPLEAARLKVRDILGSIPKRGHLGIVERWRQLPDGQIAFTMRRLPVED